MERPRASLWPVLARALTYGAAGVACVLGWLPSRMLAWSGVARPSEVGPAQWAGGVLVLLGIVPMAWSFLSFVFRGRGTPAPFDPPRILVVSGPYRYVRNPMYLGAMTSLLGAAVHYASPALFAYLAAFAVWAHLFVVVYEEPRLRRTFGPAYKAYAAQVRRWLPRRAS
ncbi:MAG: isoprenylcysteine carboxylmethyltransferase family protein [Gemmatimonadetes bacterium]|nr:isoprenylcysteine carboxylmethyltransferase family protein [Gemmatimonadota bacterium]